MRYALVLVVLAGCSSTPTVSSAQVQGPQASDQERALQLVWEGVYGMEIASRPASITWWPSDGCHEELNATGISAADTCASDSEGSRGDVYIRWEGSVSASSFSRALVIWRQYLMTGNMTRPSADDFTLINVANDALVKGGL